jgi:hypothetical protein
MTRKSLVSSGLSLACALCLGCLSSMPAEAKLIGLWSGNGNALDASITQNHGLFSGSFGSGPTPGSQAFDLATGTVIIPDNQAYENLRSARWTISFSFNANGTSLDAGNGVFLGQDQGPGEVPKWFISYGYGDAPSQNRFFLHVNNFGGSPREFFYSDEVTLLSGWNDLSVSRGGGAISFGLNGTAVGSVAYDDIVAFANPAAPLSFGYLEPCCAFRGLLANVSISAVPEPASWFLLVAGFGLTGVVVRRRHSPATI